MMSKGEITHFKNNYHSQIEYLSKKDNYCKFLLKAMDFERPDGYYYDKNNDSLVIFEHFEIDCSERVDKNGKPLGSILRKNSSDKNKEIKKELKSCSEASYESVKLIEQGYYEENDNGKTFFIGKDGDKYRNNYVANFQQSFNSHNKSKLDYINRVVAHLGIHPQEVKIAFVIEDKTLFGTYYKTKNNNFDSPVILTNTLQLQETLNLSDVDCVIFASPQHEIVSIAHKGDSVTDKIDLQEKEFFILPLGPLITSAIKK